MNSVHINRQALRALIVLGAFLLVPSFLFAHPGHEEVNGFAFGFLHPFSGLDHLCALIAVGIWAAMNGGRARWVAPLTFISMMMAGGLLGMAGMTVPFIEGGIVASLLVLGILIAAAVRLSPMVGFPLIGFFALFHGYAHGIEMPESASGMLYGAGFILSTVILHLVGIVLVLSMQRLEKSALVRYAGAAIAIIGVLMWAGW